MSRSKKGKIYWREILLKDSIIIFVTTLIVTSAGLILKGLNVISIAEIDLVFLITLIVIVVIASSPISEFLREAIEDINRQVAQHSIPFLMDTDQINHYESATKSREIWVITQDLRTDLKDGAYREAVTHNLNNGCTYSYFVPDTPQVRAQIRQYREHYSNNFAHLYHFYRIPQEFLLIVSDLHTVIYHSPNNDSTPTIAFMGLPVPQPNESYYNFMGRVPPRGDIHYYTALSREFILRIVGILGQYQRVEEQL